MCIRDRSIAEHNKIVFNQITKIIFVFDETNAVQATEIKNIFDTSKIHNSETNYFIKTPKGAWQETPIS